MGAPHISPASLRAFIARRDQRLASIRTTRIAAAAIVAASTVVAYSLPVGSVFFIMLLPLLAIQIFESVAYTRLIEIVAATRRIRAGMAPGYEPASWLAGAGLAVKNSYFALFVCFDTIWLLHSYLRPVPAATWDEYLLRLAVGPITGCGFLWFTLFFWAVYTTLLLVGIARGGIAEDTWYPRERLRALLGDQGGEWGGPDRIEFSVPVACYDGATIHLRGLRMPRPGAQPLILWPGFYQNGFVYDLLPGERSLAEYLWRKGFDIWIVHSRGTGGSEGGWAAACLDDYAAFDIPAVIDHVARHTAMKPVYVGHSQGGITAIMSMMGACRRADGSAFLSDEESRARQSRLRGLVTLGSFLDFTFTKRSALKEFATQGFGITLFGRRVTILRGETLLGILRILPFVPMPVGLSFREGLTERASFRLVLFPLYVLLMFAGRLGLWEFLYHIPNVDELSRDTLFCRTMDGTFQGILTQFFNAVRDSAMKSLDGAVNYSAEYHRIALPVSFVTMEHDTLAHPATARSAMFAQASSPEKYFTEWKGLGHEDHFMNRYYFPQVYEAIAKVCPEATWPD